jgi:hypothetical protein
MSWDADVHSNCDAGDMRAFHSNHHESGSTGLLILSPSPGQQSCCSKMAEAEAAVSVNEKKWLVMHMHVQLKLDEQSCECSVQTLVG